jgi:hypothetical protein
MKTAFQIALATAALSLSLTASATTITFNSLEHTGSNYQSMATYQEGGFNLDAHGSFASAEQGTTGWYFGSASLFNNAMGGTTTLTKIGGGTFSFDSIDLAPVSTTYSTGATVSFTGQVHGGGTVNQAFTLSNGYAFSTFSFSGFNNLDSVSWVQASPFHQFDNLVLDQSSNVPEPASLALIGLAAAAMGLARRKSR